MLANLTVQARWLFPADGPPIENGRLTIADGRIVSVEPAEHRKADVDYGQSAILPGLVNAHTHLDLSSLQGKLPPPSAFTDWLRDVIAFRRQVTSNKTRMAIRKGIAFSLCAGTTLLGDISADGSSASFLREYRFRALVFHELIGLPPQRAAETWSAAEYWLHAQPTAYNVRVGLSPHSSYSARKSLFSQAAKTGLPLAIHFAETPFEADLLEKHQGPMRSFLEELGAWNDSDLTDHLSAIIDCCPQACFVHANYLDSVLIDRLRGKNVVYCPRTHLYFGHPPHPFRDLLANGVNVALGTDSLASNPDLSILNEMRFLHRRYPDFDGETLLRMGTLNGAKALGWEKETGSLTPGKSADWVVVPLDASKDISPYARWLNSPEPVKETWIGGQRVVKTIGTPITFSVTRVPSSTGSTGFHLNG